jgi:hypothetical protein
VLLPSAAAATACMTARNLRRSVMWLPAAPAATLHMNEYLRLPVAQYPDVSSEARMAAALALPTPRDAPTILTVLGDTRNASYPIYRAGGAVVTLASVVFACDATAGCTMRVWMNNPSLPAVAALPVLTSAFGGPPAAPSAAAPLSIAAAVALGAVGLLVLQGVIGAVWARRRIARACKCGACRGGDDPYDALATGAVH